jgi:hypothetical protein
MVDREGRIAAEQERIERGLHLVGATAVEDKLQVSWHACTAWRIGRACCRCVQRSCVAWGCT